MKRKINKLLALSFLVLPCMLVSCGEEETPEENYSDLTGTFTYDIAVRKNDKDEDLRIFNTTEDAVNGHLYTSNYYPLNTVNGSKVGYSYQQSLKLKRDYTYEYQYTITLTNSEEWGKDFASINVELSGTFEYEMLSEDLESAIRTYSVTLNNPTSGKETIYGITVTGLESIFAWNLNTVASYELDIASALELEKENFEYNRLIKGRQVEVIKGEERVLTDNIYYYDIMTDIGPYCDYNL